ncbi:MAG TPA: hypothetical protein VKJ45_05860 [Blastocatellia bacterium]|nr:hypothetical protein [Blastocatellia bacterium]
MNDIKSIPPEKRADIAIRIVVGAALVGTAILAAAMIFPKLPECLGE